VLGLNLLGDALAEYYDSTRRWGAREANLTLSQPRADSIREVLTGTITISPKRHYLSALVCENASNYDPTQKGAHVVVYTEKSTSSVGVAYRAKRYPTEFGSFLTISKHWGAWWVGSLFRAHLKCKATTCSWILVDSLVLHVHDNARFLLKATDSPALAAGWSEIPANGGINLDRLWDVEHVNQRSAGCKCFNPISFHPKPLSRQPKKLPSFAQWNHSEPVVVAKHDVAGLSYDSSHDNIVVDSASFLGQGAFSGAAKGVDRKVVPTSDCVNIAHSTVDNQTGYPLSPNQAAQDFSCISGLKAPARIHCHHLPFLSNIDGVKHEA
jgi:hypothetical protein